MTEAKVTILHKGLPVTRTVDRDVLSKYLHESARVNRRFGRRPGQPLFTEEAMSRERFAVLQAILDKDIANDS